MSTRTTLVLAGLLVVIGAVAFVVQGPCSSDRAREHEAVFSGLVPGAVRAVRAKRPDGGELLLARAGTGWVLGASKEAADAAAVDKLLADLASLAVNAVVSRNAAKQAGYEADAAKGIAVRLEGDGGRTIAAFVVGKSGPDYSSSYLRREGATEILLVSKDLRFEFSRPAESWRAPPQKEAAAAPDKPPEKP